MADPCVISSSIPFAISLEVPCGFLPTLNAAVPPVQTLISNLTIDKHCVHCVRTCAQTDVLIGNTTCNMNVLAYKLLGALHYTMTVGQLAPVLPGVGLASTQLTKSQSICVNNIYKIDNCKETLDCCADPEACDYKLAVKYTEVKLYSENSVPVAGDPVNPIDPLAPPIVGPVGINLYVDPNALPANLVLSESALAAFATGTASNANGCKTIIYTGTVEISAP